MQLPHIIDNLKDVLSHELGQKRVFDKDIAQALGLSRESLSQMKRRNRIPYEAIVYFCAKRQLSINWILFDQIPKSLEEKTEKFARIKYFKNLHTSAGGGALNDEEGFEYLLIDYAGLNTISRTAIENLHAINVIGDSMEPTLNDKEIILCDVSITQMENNGIYIINTASEGLLVKRLKKEEEGIAIISDNLQYKEQWITPLNAQDVTIIGRVLGTLVMEK